MKLFKTKKPYKILDGYQKLSDVYSESPFGHHENATSSDKEEYFMQWVFPAKLNLIALRTPVGFRIIYQYAKDLWNNRVSITIPNEKDKTQKINRKLFSHLIELNWFQEMEKLSAFEREQGESILLCYYDDEGGLDKYEYPIDQNKPILRVEAFSPLRYNIPAFDKHGKPQYYLIEVKDGNNWRSTRTVRIHPSRVLRKCSGNLEFRFTGYSDLSAVYDAIVVLSSILKATGEAAFRWSTGLPVFFTKDLMDGADLDKLKDVLKNLNRRHWLALPTEHIDRAEMLSQAGSMLNLKALAEICIDLIVIGTGIPKPILLGEIAGVLGSKVSERSYFAKLDSDHSDLDYFVRSYFKKDVNVRRIFRGIDYFNLNWGIREEFNKMDEAEYKQKMVSNALAMTQICSLNEARKYLDLEPVPEESGGDMIGNFIIGSLPIYEQQWNMTLSMLEMGLAEEEMNQTVEGIHGEPQTNTSMDQKARSTEKKAASQKDLEKNKRVAPPTRTDNMNDPIKEKLKDAIKDIRNNYSINQICKDVGIYDKTIYKLIKWSES